MKDGENEVPKEPQSKKPRKGKKGLSRREVLRGTLAGLTALSATSVAGASALGELTRRPLVLKHEGLREAVANLFQLLNRDAASRETFIHNPTQTVLTAVLPDYADRLTPQRVSDANRLLFSLMANDGFRTWAQEYQVGLNAEIAAGRLRPENIDKAAIAQDLAKAFAEYGDQDIMAGLLATHGGAAATSPVEELPSVEVYVETYAVVAVVVVLILFAIDISPITDNADIRVTAAEMRSLADQLVHEAKLRRAAGDLRDLSADVR